jgi:hypothetical protein
LLPSLVIAQVALSLLLPAGAGLFVRARQNLETSIRVSIPIPLVALRHE